VLFRSDANTVIDFFSDIWAGSLVLPNASLTTTAQNVQGTLMYYKPLSFTSTIKANPAPAPTTTSDFVTFTATLGNYVVPTCTAAVKIALVRWP
jgi:hypothetical protein